MKVEIFEARNWKDLENQLKIFLHGPFNVQVFAAAQSESCDKNGNVISIRHTLYYEKEHRDLGVDE